MSFFVDWKVWTDDKFLDKARFHINGILEHFFLSHPSLPMTGLYIKKLCIFPPQCIVKEQEEIRGSDSPIEIVKITDPFPLFLSATASLDEVILFESDSVLIYRTLNTSSFNSPFQSTTTVIQSPLVSPVILESPQEGEGFSGIHQLCKVDRLGIIMKSSLSFRHGSGNIRTKEIGSLACPTSILHSGKPHATRPQYGRRLDEGRISLLKHLYEGNIQFELKLQLSMVTDILIFTALGLSIPIPQFATLPIKSQISGVNLQMNCWVAIVPERKSFYVSVKRGWHKFAFDLQMDMITELGDVTISGGKVLKNVSKVGEFLKEILYKLVEEYLVYPRYMKFKIK